MYLDANSSSPKRISYRDPYLKTYLGKKSNSSNSRSHSHKQYRQKYLNVKHYDSSSESNSFSSSDESNFARYESRFLLPNIRSLHYFTEKFLYKCTF